MSKINKQILQIFITGSHAPLEFANELVWNLMIKIWRKKISAAFTIFCTFMMGKDFDIQAFSWKSNWQGEQVISEKVFD